MIPARDFKLMATKSQIITEIHRLDEKHLDTIYKIVRQLTRSAEIQHEAWGEEAAAILREIAEHGGLGIKDPLEWQGEIRKERKLPFRGE